MTYRGQRAAVTLSFTDAAGAPADPAGVLVTLVSPSGVETTYSDTDPEVEHVTVGEYLFRTPPLADVGSWVWQGETTDAEPQIVGGVIEVIADPLSTRPEHAIAMQSLRMMSEAASFPTLTDDELHDVLRRNVRPDHTGATPADAAWVPTYALGGAARDAWIVKAGKVANRVNSSDGSLNVSRSDLLAHCMTMADRYAMKVMTSVPLASSAAAPLVPAFNSDAVPLGAHEPGTGTGTWQGAA